MKIWIDFINTPQVTFFIPFINDFRKNGHEVMLTCRNSGNTVSLLENTGFPFVIISEGAGRGMLQKLFFFSLRLIKLFRYVKKNKPDIAASQSSFYQPVVARLLRVPCLYTNDNEYARGNLFGFLFACEVFLPKSLMGMSFVKRWPLKKKVFFYPSVKEAIYLSQQTFSDKTDHGKGTKIYFRPEPWSAQYYKGPLNFFDDILIKLSLNYEVIVLSRDQKQCAHYLQEKFNNLKVLLSPLTLGEIANDCLLFIGAGGSMTREMAVLNIPVISIYQSELLSVDNSLIDMGLMNINPRLSYDEIISFVNRPRNHIKETGALLEGIQSFNMIKKHIYNLKHE
jgi:predicted glycosyltransferase